MNLQITDERNRALRKRFDMISRDYGVNSKYIDRAYLLDMMEQSPAPRFYIDAKQAERYVIAYYKNQSAASFKKTSARQRMMLDLVEVFERVRSANMDKQMREIWEMVVREPAKEFYISRTTIKKIVFNYRYKLCKRN